MACKRASRRKGLFRVMLIAAVGACVSACATAGDHNPFNFGRIDQASPAAADIHAAERAPGPYPRFAEIPAAPKDVRPVSAWKASVSDLWGVKRRTEAEAGAIPFVLTEGDADSWAQAERSKIPAVEMISPTRDESDSAEAYAEAQRERATPPPSPK
jgi:hypothetical protein